MTEIFIDSSALFAWADKSSAHNRPIHDYLLIEHPPLVTSNLVIAETLSLITKRVGKYAGIQFAAALEDSQIIQVVYVDSVLTKAALRTYRKYKDKDFDLIDAISFAICKERNIRQALTLDHHFAQMGLEMLPG